MEYTFCHLLRDSSWRGQGIFKRSCFRLRVNKKSSSERHTYLMPMPKNIFKVGELVRTKAKERISKQVFSFFGKFGVFCFLETPVLRFALMPYYQRIQINRVREFRFRLLAGFSWKLSQIWYLSVSIHSSLCYVIHFISFSFWLTVESNFGLSRSNMINSETEVTELGILIKVLNITLLYSSLIYASEL